MSSCFDRGDRHQHSHGGPGDIFISGPDVKFIDIALLDRLLHEMVKMSPLQGSRFEVIPTSDEMGIIGAAVNADRATQN